jgi:antibiotic biosynthesis monooxygenase (ABM) superfamily enzyme
MGISHWHLLPSLSFPLLTALAFIVRMIVLTILIVFAMYWIVMPRLLRWLAWWLKR